MGLLAGVDSALVCPKPFPVSPCCVVQGGLGMGEALIVSSQM